MTGIRPIGPWTTVIVLAWGLAACGRNESPDVGAAVASRSPGTADSSPSGSESIYALDLSLVDDTGAASRLADLQGRTIVAAMMYATCTTVCPRVTADMKAIERQLEPAEKADVTFALFSLDPGRDTPAVMRRFADEHGLDDSRWRLFATSEDGVRELAAVLGVKYARQADGEIAHSAMIFVIDRHGVVRHRQVGLTESPRELADAIARARS
jgi:protein SCO1/2